MKKILVANRGEIALRVIRAARQEGLCTVAVYSRADANSPHAWAADEAVCIGPAAARDSYLLSDTLVAVARATGCSAVHPGYGFLAENAAFAAACEENGLVFVGPRAETIAAMGDKAAARTAAVSCGVPVVPGSEGSFLTADAAREAAHAVGLPLLLKARAGGGGRGMRAVAGWNQFDVAFAQAVAEASAAFGDGHVYIERYFPAVRHVEVQVFGDGEGGAVHLWERDCSVQRRHQKLLEEAPSPSLDHGSRAAMCEAARRLAAEIGYRGAGTVEFLYSPEERSFHFIEMNTRIQVEHPVTEMLLGVDLVREQLRLAAGHPMSWNMPPTPSGHVIEMRINAEDPARGFAPSPGRLALWRPPSGRHIRFDSHAYEGYELPPYYDSLLGKLVVRGDDRGDAIGRALGALATFEVAGLATTIPFHRYLLSRPEFRAGTVHTRWVEAEMSAHGT